MESLSIASGRLVVQMRYVRPTEGYFRLSADRDCAKMNQGRWWKGSR